jgi:hypothetical protein
MSTPVNPVTHPVRRLTRQILFAGFVAVAFLVPVDPAWAANSQHSANATVTLDSPGSVKVDAFDPALGSLTAVELSQQVDVLVQACIENRASAPASADGSATAVLDASFPGDLAAADATALAKITSTRLAASNGSADCVNGFDRSAGRFTSDVRAGDTTFVQKQEHASASARITDPTELARFIGAGTVDISYTSSNDTKLAFPENWDNVSVAQGHIAAEVTYIYTPSSGPGNGGLPPTGTSIGLATVIAGLAAVALGVALLIIARIRRTRGHRPS